MAGDPPPESAKKVLIVEDNVLNLKLLNDLLEYHGYQIFSTASGEAALQLAEHEMPDLILMDIQLPDMSGIDATRRLKANPRTTGIPIIAVTAFAMSGDRAIILESGCDEYVSKPFSVAELLALVGRYTKKEEA
jgi:two-component system, cell cycle response regulator DivK